MNNRTPRKSTSTAARLAAASQRIGVSKRVTAAALVAADTATRSLRTAAAHPLVRDISAEADGTWIYLAHGWRCCNSETNAIAEDTAAEALACLKRAYFEPDVEDMAEIEKDAAAARAKSDAAISAAYGVKFAAPDAEAKPLAATERAWNEVAARDAARVDASAAVDTAAREHGFISTEYSAALSAYSDAVAAHRLAIEAARNA